MPLKVHFECRITVDGAFLTWLCKGKNQLFRTERCKIKLHWRYKILVHKEIKPNKRWKTSRKKSNILVNYSRDDIVIFINLIIFDFDIDSCHITSSTDEIHDMIASSKDGGLRTKTYSNRIDYWRFSSTIRTFKQSINYWKIEEYYELFRLKVYKINEQWEFILIIKCVVWLGTLMTIY